MTNEQILKRAIRKAVDNGFQIPRGLQNIMTCCEADRYSILSFIFSHDFAKAFWGEIAGCGEKNCKECQPNWQEKLQMMVLEKEPLKYIEKYL